MERNAAVAGWPPEPPKLRGQAKEHLSLTSFPHLCRVLPCRGPCSEGGCPGALQFLTALVPSSGEIPPWWAPCSALTIWSIQHEHSQLPKPGLLQKRFLERGWYIPCALAEGLSLYASPFYRANLEVTDSSASVSSCEKARSASLSCLSSDLEVTERKHVSWESQKGLRSWFGWEMRAPSIRTWAQTTVLTEKAGDASMCFSSQCWRRQRDRQIPRELGSPSL